MLFLTLDKLRSFSQPLRLGLPVSSHKVSWYLGRPPEYLATDIAAICLLSEGFKKEYTKSPISNFGLFAPLVSNRFGALVLIDVDFILVIISC